MYLTEVEEHGADEGAAGRSGVHVVEEMEGAAAEEESSSTDSVSVAATGGDAASGGGAERHLLSDCSLSHPYVRWRTNQRTETWLSHQK